MLLSDVSSAALRGRVRTQTQEKALDNLIDTFETRDNDVFVCTYVKSGTTWTQQIINLVSLDLFHIAKVWW